MITAPYACTEPPADKRRANPRDMGQHKPRELSHPSPHLRRTAFSTILITSPPLVIRNGKNWKNLHDSTSSIPVDENESHTQRGVQEFFCLVEFFSHRNQNH